MSAPGPEPPTHRPPTESGSEAGLAWLLWMPPSGEPPHPGVVICHGAGSRKENHADFARLASGAGWAAVSFDARGHGDSEGAMGPDAVDDVVRIAGLLGSLEEVDETRLITRGSSMGGFLAIHAVAATGALAGAIAICPAGEEQLIILHAEGDEQIPYVHSRELHERGREPRRLIIVPGGNHRSVQHDAELQMAALRWIERKLAERRGGES